MAWISPARRATRLARSTESPLALKQAVGNLLRPLIVAVSLFLLWYAYPGINVFGTTIFIAVMILLFTALPFVDCERAMRVSAWRWWSIYSLGFVGFALLRSFADQTGRPIFYTYPARISDWLFGGEPLAVRMQQLLPANRHDPFTLLMVGTYISFFAVPTLVALYLGRRRPEELPRYVVATLMVWIIGLTVFYLYPTAPPWMVARDGFVSPIFRVDALVISPGDYSQGLHLIGVNDVAAMPSVHVAQTWLAMIALSHGRRRLRIASLVYAVAMVIAVLYLGEHWFVDVVAGLALMVAAWRLSLSPLRQRRPSSRPALTAEVMPQRI